MTFLKKLGQIIVSGLQLVTGFLPVLQATLPGSAGAVQTVSKDLADLMNIIVAVEAMGAASGLPGADKARIAAPQIAQILLQSALLVGKPIANAPLFSQGCQEIAGGLADCLNAVHPDAVNATPVNIVPPPVAPLA